MDGDLLELEFLDDDDDERLISEDEVEHLDKIFAMPLKTKEDLLRLADLTDEGEEFN